MNKTYENIIFIFENTKIPGSLILTDDFLTFKPYDKEYSELKEAVYRLVQTGFRKIANIIPNKIYIKTMSGKVLYFITFKAKKIAKDIENLIY